MTLVEQLLVGAAMCADDGYLTDPQRDAVEVFLYGSRLLVERAPLAWGVESFEEWSDRMDRQAAACWA